MTHCTLRVRAVAERHLPAANGGFVGWRCLSRPRWTVVDMALNPARLAVGLPACIQHHVPAGGWRQRDGWWVPKDSTTVLRPTTYATVRHYAKAICDGDLAADDDATSRVAHLVHDAAEEEAAAATYSRLQLEMEEDLARKAAGI